MASAPLDKKKDAQHHTVLATEQWVTYVNSIMGEATSTLAQQAQVARRQQVQNIYSQAEPGGS